MNMNYTASEQVESRRQDGSAFVGDGKRRCIQSEPSLAHEGQLGRPREDAHLMLFYIILIPSISS